jgi:hypothetical protein
MRATGHPPPVWADRGALTPQDKLANKNEFIAELLH